MGQVIIYHLLVYHEYHIQHMLISLIDQNQATLIVIDFSSIKQFS